MLTPRDFVILLLAHFELCLVNKRLREICDSQEIWKETLLLLLWEVGLRWPLLATWWRHNIDTFSALLALCARNSPVTGEFPSQGPVTRNFGVFFDLRLNKRLSKQSRRRWFQMQSRLLWRHYNELLAPFVRGNLQTRFGQYKKPILQDLSITLIALWFGRRL